MHIQSTQKNSLVKKLKHLVEKTPVMMYKPFAEKKKDICVTIKPQKIAWGFVQA